MGDRHVVPADDGWQVEKDDARRASAKAPTQAEAVERAVEIVANSGGGAVIVHGADGEVRRSRTVDAAAEKPAPTAVTARAAMARAGIHGTDDADQQRGQADLRPQRKPRELETSRPGRPPGGVSGWVQLSNPLRIAARVTGWPVSAALRSLGALGARARRHLP